MPRPIVISRVEVAGLILGSGDRAGMRAELMKVALPLRRTGDVGRRELAAVLARYDH